MKSDNETFGIKEKLKSQLSKLHLKSLEKFRGIKSKYALFSKEVPIPGFREVATANHWTVGLAWIIFICVGLMLTVHFIYAVIVEYLNEPIATKVTKVHQKNYDFPPIYFCLSSWKNDKELLALDMTELASKYMYSLVFEERLDEADYDQAKSEFEEFAAQHNFTYYREALVHGSWSLDQFESYQCVGCSKITHLFAMKAKKACYQIEFPTVSAAEGARSIFAAEFRHPSDSTPNNYLIIGADHRTAYFYDLISVSAGHTYDVRLTAQQDKSFPKPPDNFCKTKAEVESENYNQQLCFDDCFVNHYASSYNCQPISNDDKIINPDRESDICSTKHGSLTKPREEVKEPDTLTVTNFIKEVTEKCQSKCIYPCESISYEFTLTDKSNTNKANTTTIFFMLEYARKGILTYEEIPTLSFQSAVSNVGGQLGLWMGLSIVSLFQLLSYFINCFIPRAIMSS